MFTTTATSVLQGQSIRLLPGPGRVRGQGVDSSKRAPTGGPAILEQIKVDMVSTLLMEMKGCLTCLLTCLSFYLENVAHCPPLSLTDVFFSVSLALMVASLLETVVITHIQLSSSHGAIPDWLRTLVLQYVAILVCLPPLKKKRAVTVFLNPSVTGTGGKFLLFTKTVKRTASVPEGLILIYFHKYYNKRIHIQTG